MSQKQDNVPKPKAKRRRRKTDTPPTKSNMAGKQTNSGLTGVGDSSAQSASSFAPSSSSFVPPMLIPNPMTSMPSCVPPSQQNPWMNDFSQKLEFIMNKMGTLDTIVSKQNAVLARLDNIESSLSAHSREISELKESQKFISEKYDSISQTTNVNKQKVTQVQGECIKLSELNKSLQSENSKLREEVVDVQCRSMRENLLFMGIPEDNNWAQTQHKHVAQHDEHESMEGATGVDTDNTAPKTYANAVTQEEDCISKVYDFCKIVLKIEKPESFEIDVAHRIGKRSVGKIRPIVAKFVKRQDKDNLKKIAQKVNLKDTAYNVSEQWPKVVQDRRKNLIPKMVSFRNQGKRAVLVRDKLFVDGVEFKEEGQ